MGRIERTGKKVLCALMLGTALCAALTGCKGKTDENGSSVSEDGRSYGGVLQISQGEKADTAFFDLTVDEALQYDTYQFDDGLYQTQEGNVYLVVKVTVKNTYEEDLPMCITDFVLDYDGNEETEPITGYGNTDLKDSEFMDNLFTLKQGESITKNILYTVAEKEEYTLQYKEYYEDGFEGNTYQIQITPEKKTTGN
jgi:hypothetical protein